VLRAGKEREVSIQVRRLPGKFCKEGRTLDDFSRKLEGKGRGDDDDDDDRCLAG